MICFLISEGIELKAFTVDGYWVIVHLQSGGEDRQGVSNISSQ